MREIKDLRELVAQGKREARRAIGAPGQGAVGTAFVVGLILGACAAAILTMLTNPLPGPEARRRLSEQVDRVRERIPSRGNGHAAYEPVATSAEVGSSEVLETS